MVFGLPPKRQIKIRRLKVLITNYTEEEAPKPPKPLYGVDGNLLIEDLGELPKHRQRHVEDVRYRNWITDHYFIGELLGDYPQLKAEREKRRHRELYRAKLRGKLFARRVEGVVGQDDPR